MTKLFEKRFSELESQVISIEATKQRRHSEYSGSYDHVDDNLILNWQVKVKNLLSNLCGEDSQHFTAFIEAGKASSFTSNFTILQQMKAVFMAAKEDFEGGYLNSVRNLVQAEVFDNELDQAKELLSSGYAAAAAVIAGVVLETSLRNLCSDNGIPFGKLDKMNADLTKQGIYNSLIQKRITALAGIRNSAAHGKTDEFNKDDVNSMINEIERFVGSTLA
ncbi:DUF4145 domain-containing protein [Stutzerimonas xanthomarina]|uniref:DUF4145 domain-containing protein n=1 Tax=Stutzerimonas xanthomarina TaxID=271420 RepID=A0A3R8V610_9GAMM|nr:DUF4145 domain-containing protein [Stutzerimonas xanthomarina]RRV03630.1 DUF4145 domain-containing protein [Stutzerimonas xanthomarina]